MLSVAPGLLIMVTSFTRFIVALSFLRAGLGLQSTPANLILISLALFMTFFVMEPTFERAYETGCSRSWTTRSTRRRPIRASPSRFAQFMLAHVRERDLDLFRDLAAQAAPASGETPPLQTSAAATSGRDAAAEARRSSCASSSRPS